MLKNSRLLIWDEKEKEKKRLQCSYKHAFIFYYAIFAQRKEEMR